MNLLTFISNLMIPIIIFLIIGYGLASRTNIFDAFVKGASDGMKVVAGVLPTLIGLLIAIGILRESGCLEALAGLLEPLAEVLRFNHFRRGALQRGRSCPCGQFTFCTWRKWPVCPWSKRASD